MDQEKIFIGVLILVIVLSIGSILIVSNMNSDNIPEKNIIYKEKADVQSGSLNLKVISTPANSGVSR